MKKENFQKKTSKRVSNKPTTDKEKRFSKSKFRKDVEESRAVGQEQAVSKAYTSSPRKNYDKGIEEVYKFRSKKAEKTFQGILTQQTLQKKGYSVLPKGQCVTVEEFAEDGYARFTANDGRVGIGYSGFAKSMFG